jgi:hypothetical protein
MVRNCVGQGEINTKHFLSLLARSACINLTPAEVRKIFTGLNTLNYHFLCDNQNEGVSGKNTFEYVNKLRDIIKRT